MANRRLFSIASLLILLAGCTSNGSHHHNGQGSVEHEEGSSYGVPASARIVGETKGGRMEYPADDDGKVYLADDSAHTVIWDGRVRRGDRVYVNPDKNRIEINGKKQADIDLKSNHRFVLFFDRY